MPDALTLWSLAVLVIGGLMYAMISQPDRFRAALVRERIASELR